MENFGLLVIVIMFFLIGAVYFVIRITIRSNIALIIKILRFLQANGPKTIDELSEQLVCPKELLVMNLATMEANHYVIGSRKSIAPRGSGEINLMQYGLTIIGQRQLEGPSPSVSFGRD